MVFRRSSVTNVSRHDIVIAVMGPTGVGKSNFIDKATNQGGKWVGHSLRSCTDEVQTIKVPYSKSNRSVVFVDTPGFDDTYKPDTDILKMIADWLESTYRKDIKLTAIIYLHRISDNRMSGAPQKNLHVFEKLCGDDAIRRGKVVLATTMWDRISNEVGVQRERELQEQYWKTMIALGSSVKRFLDTPESAWDIVDGLINLIPHEVLLQVEMVKMKKRLNETQAGRALFKELQDLLGAQKETEQQLRNAARTQNDPTVIEQLDKQLTDVHRRLQVTLDQIHEMRIPVFRQAILWFKR